jgi:hypothetical protein
VRGALRAARVALLAGCGAGAALLAACGAGGAADDGGAAADGAVCVGDAPAADALLVVASRSDGGAAFCGGALGLAGVTPFGLFAPDAVSAEVVLPPQATLQITLAQDPPAGPQLTFDVPGDPVTGSFGGVHDVAGFLESGGVVMPVTVHADVTSATLAAPPDGGAPDAGEARMTVTITTDCGAFSGTIDARYCGWQSP